MSEWFLGQLSVFVENIFHFFMASQKQVREYLAHWFQLGKPIVLTNGQTECLPYPIFRGTAYSQAFEECWQQIMATRGEGCYLKGTYQTVSMMLSSAWDVTPCARCNMPVVIPVLGTCTYPCPCHDLNDWPNTEIPAPRLTANDAVCLSSIQTRLGTVEGHPVSARSKVNQDEDDDVTKTFSSWRGMA